MGQPTVDICQLCGRRKQLNNSNGKMLCSTCVVVVTAARQRPDTLIAALREHNKDHIDAQSSGNAAVDELVMERDSLKQDLAELRAQTEKDASTISDLQRQLEDAKEKNADLVKEYDMLKKQLEEASVVNAEFEPPPPSFDKSRLTSIIGRIAQGVVAGKMRVSSGVMRDLRKLVEA